MQLSATQKVSSDRTAHNDRRAAVDHHRLAGGVSARGTREEDRRSSDLLDSVRSRQRHPLELLVEMSPCSGKRTAGANRAVRSTRVADFGERPWGGSATGVSLFAADYRAEPRTVAAIEGAEEPLPPRNLDQFKPAASIDNDGSAALDALTATGMNSRGRSRSSVDSSDHPQEPVELGVFGRVEHTHHAILCFATKRFDPGEQLLTGRRDIRIESTTTIGSRAALDQLALVECTHDLVHRLGLTSERRASRALESPGRSAMTDRAVSSITVTPLPSSAWVNATDITRLVRPMR